MAFHLFGKKKEEEEIPEDVGFETPPTLANPTGIPNPSMPPNPTGAPNMNLPNPSMPPNPNLPPLPPNPTGAPNPNLPNPTNNTLSSPNLSNPMPSPYPVEITRPQPQVSPQIEEEVKLLSTKIESINVRLNTLSQKLDYLINLIRQRYQI